MSPEEVELLQHAGQIIISNIANIVSLSVLYGLYLAIFSFGIRALLKRNPWTGYTGVLFGFLSVLFLISTASLASNVAKLIGLIRGAFVNNADQPLIDRFQLADASVEGINIADIWLGGGSGGGFLLVFADAVVVWRAYVLWPGNKIAKTLPVVLLMASLGSAVVSALLATIAFSESNIVPTSSPAGIMLILSQSLSLATNVVATMLIGYKAYYHRQMMKTNMGVQGSTSGAILLFLTESGVAFCLLQIIAAATNASDNKSASTLDYVANVWAELSFFAAACSHLISSFSSSWLIPNLQAAYPVLVLIIVDSHRSIADHTGSAADSGAAHGSNSLGVGSHLSFAAPPPGLSSSGGEVGTDSLTGSRIDAASDSADRSDTVGAVRFRDLEKGEGLTAGAFSRGRR